MIKIKRIKTKKSVSPVVSTVLLIAIVIILAIIILLWSKGFIKEKILKDVGGASKPINSVCSEVSIRTHTNDDGTFGFSNIGNIPIYAFNLETSESGTGKTEIYKEDDKVGAGNSINIDDYYTYYEKIKIIPILLGRNKEGVLKEYSCSEHPFTVI